MLVAFFPIRQSDIFQGTFFFQIFKLFIYKNGFESDASKMAALTHWLRVALICVGKLTTIVSDNGLYPGRRQAIIWTNAGILLIGL